jgi:hypothetical protein
LRSVVGAETPFSGKDREGPWGYPWRQARPSPQAQVSREKCSSRQALARARPSDSGGARKGECAPTLQRSQTAACSQQAPGHPARPPQRAARPPGRTPSVPPVPPPSRSHPGPSQGRGCGWRECLGAVGATLVLAPTAPRGPANAVSSDFQGSGETKEKL